MCLFQRSRNCLLVSVLLLCLCSPSVWSDVVLSDEEWTTLSQSLEIWRQSLSESNSDWKQREADYQRRLQGLNEREQSLQEWESDLNERESDLTERELRLNLLSESLKQQKRGRLLERLIDAGAGFIGGFGAGMLMEGIR